MNYKLLSLNYNSLIPLTCIENNRYRKIHSSEDGFIDFSVILDNATKNYIKELLNLPVDIEVMFFVNPPNSSCIPHIDDVRLCAINFPVNVPGTVYIAKESNNEYFLKNRNGNNFPIINNDNLQFYDQFVLDSHPVIFDPTVPHGAKNLTNETRYIVSCSLTKPFSDIVKIFEQRGQVINTI